MREEWRSVVGYESNYQVSNLGRVRSIARRSLAGKVLRPWEGGEYRSVHLSQNGRVKWVRVHTLVAEAFIGRRPIGSVVNHKNADKKYNVDSNLEYVSHGENIRLGFALKTRHVVRSDGKVFSSARAAGIALGSPSGPWGVLQGHQKTCKGFTFTYANR